MGFKGWKIERLENWKIGVLKLEGVNWLFD
jgi:hypothetical protein